MFIVLSSWHLGLLLVHSMNAEFANAHL